MAVISHNLPVLEKGLTLACRCTHQVFWLAVWGASAGYGLGVGICRDNSSEVVQP